MKKFFAAFIIIVIFTISSSLSLNSVLASNGDSGTGGGDGGTGEEDNGDSTSASSLPNPLRTNNIVNLFNEILEELIVYVAPPIVSIMVIFGAFQILTAGGNPDKFTLGKKTIFYAVIGYAILLIVTGIGAIIKELLGVQ